MDLNVKIDFNWEKAFKVPFYRLLDSTGKDNSNVRHRKIVYPFP